MLRLLQRAHYHTNPTKYCPIFSWRLALNYRKDGPLAHEHAFVNCYPGVANIPTDTQLSCFSLSALFQFAPTVCTSLAHDNVTIIS